MYILSRYLLRQFCQIFLICLLSLTGLYVVIDAFGHLDHFSSYAQREGNLFGVIAEFYAYRSLSFFDRTSGILAMIAAMFTVAWLQRHQELTAIMAAGISKTRIVAPLLAATAIVSFAAAANREIFVPRARDQLLRETKDLAGDADRDMEARYDSSGILLGGEKLIPAERRIVNPAFVLPGNLSQHGKQLNALVADYYEPDGDRPAGFILRGVTAPRSLLTDRSLSVDGRPLIVTPADLPDLEDDELLVVTDMPFDLLANGSAWRNYASTGELIAELNRPSNELQGDVRVAVHSRIVRPLLDGTLIMLGLPLMFSRRSRNVFLSIGVCLVVATSFSLTTLASTQLGTLEMLSPSLAAWLPLLLFIPVATWIAQALRT